MMSPTSAVCQVVAFLRHPGERVNEHPVEQAALPKIVKMLAHNHDN